MKRPLRVVLKEAIDEKRSGSQEFEKGEAQLGDEILSHIRGGGDRLLC